jgi:hypothetical protein
MRSQRLPLTSGHDLLQNLNTGRGKRYTGVSTFNVCIGSVAQLVLVRSWFLTQFRIEQVWATEEWLNNHV